jgi:hypothetical protein
MYNRGRREHGGGASILCRSHPGAELMVVATFDLDLLAHMMKISGDAKIRKLIISCIVGEEVGLVELADGGYTTSPGQINIIV